VVRQLRAQRTLDQRLLRGHRRGVDLLGCHRRRAAGQLLNELLGGPSVIWLQTEASNIHAGSSLDKPSTTSTWTTCWPRLPDRRYSGTFFPWSGCYGYSITTNDDRYAECCLVRPAVGEQIGVMRPCRAEDRDHPGQRSLGAGPHVQRLDREPQRVHPDQRSISRSQAPQVAALAIGQRTRAATAPHCKSTSMN
jgi:hypothetical protein